MSESSSSTHPTPSAAQAAAALDAIAGDRAALTTGIRQPAGSDAQYAVAIAMFIAAGGLLADADAHGALWVVAPLMYFVAAVLIGSMIGRFQRLNGIWISGYRPKAARGYAFGLAGVITGLSAGSAAAGSGERWWLVAICAGIGAAAGILFSRAWVRAYIASGGAR